MLKDAVAEALTAKADESTGALARDLRRLARYAAAPRLCPDCDHGQSAPAAAVLDALARRCANCGGELG